MKLKERSSALTQFGIQQMASFDACKKEFNDVSDTLGKNPSFHKTGKLWLRRMKLMERKLGIVTRSASICQALFALENECNAEIAVARALLARIPAPPSDSGGDGGTRDSIRNGLQRKRLQATLNSAKLKNQQLTRNIKKHHVGGGQADGYFTCSRCETMYGNCHIDIFGVFDHADRDGDKTSRRFLCTCCSNKKPDTLFSENSLLYIGDTTNSHECVVQQKVSNKRSRKKRKKGKQMAKDSQLTVPLHDEVQGQNGATPVVQDIDARSQNTVSVVNRNDCWVEYLLYTGSIIALNDYMDEVLEKN